MPSERPENEQTDLEPQQRRFISDLYDRLPRLSHYEVLGIPRDAQKKAIKQAYFNLVAVIHPDRFFGKRLGPYKARVEAIFARVSAAYETLSAVDARARYDADLGESTPLGSGERAKATASFDPHLLSKQRAAVDALKQRYADARAKAREHVERGERARENSDWVAAAEAYREALRVTPSDPALKASYEAANQAAGERLVEALVRQAQMQERFGRWEQAVECWRRVTEARPHDLDARRRLKEALARTGAGR